MSLQVNFTTHGHDLKAAYEAILRPSDPKNGDNWVVFGYDKGTNDLKVLGQGSGGLEELQDEFTDGKILYAFTRVVDPFSQLNKFVLIAWCGDGVPVSKKGLFNTHLADVAKFLNGYHLQINARCDADVTPAQIMKKLQEGSGSKYSTHQESYQQERIQPLQSAYKRTEIPDIAALQRNPTKPEPAPKYNLGGTKPLTFSPSPASSSPSSTPTPSKLQDRVWPPPASSSSSNVASSPTSSNPPAERSWKTSAGGASYSAASTTASFNKVQPPSSLSSYSQSSPEPVVNKAHQIRLEREAREKEERERIKREIAASEARQTPSGASSTAQRLAEERRLQEERERERETEREREQEVPKNQGFNRVREERLAREKEEREQAEAEDAARSARLAAKAREESGVREQATAREDELKRQREQDQKREREARETEAQKSQEQEEHKKRQQEEETRRRHEEEEEERRLNQHQEEEEERQRQFEREQAEAEEQERRLQEEMSAASAQSAALGADAILASADHPELSSADSVSAIVLYSYEKAEENEMSLFEGEIIRNVTELDVGWWSGESEDGTRSGLFPANYVEVIEHSHAPEQAAAPSAEPTAHAPYQEEEEEHQYHQHEEEHAHEQPAPVGHDDAAHGEKPSAVALYDYQAGEPNEISFAEGEAIVEIDFVTDDWWSGKTESGATGLFPANYVEIIAR